MDISELLLLVDSIAKKNRLSSVFVVGGVPRDRVMSLESTTSIKDVDLTTGNEDSEKLAVILAQQLEGSVFRKYDDGHTSIDIAGLHMDFSSNFVIPGIQSELVAMGVKNISDMKMELYSRDFTINTLLEDLSFTNMYDLTSMAVMDIKAKILRCPINPEITIGIDPRRILRAIKFIIKYDMTIDGPTKAAIINNREKILSLPKKFVQDKMSEIVRLDQDRGIDILIEYKLLSLVELPKFIYDVLVQKRKLLQAI